MRVGSPQGRFADSAALVDGTGWSSAEAWGKHLFVEFAGDRYVHVHLGLYGKFDVHAGVARCRPRSARSGCGWSPASGAPRRTPTCAAPPPATWSPAEQRDAVVAALGPGPAARRTPTRTRAWARIRRSRAPIGDLLMDQTVLAGVGNVYRAEVLFRHRIHPLRPGRRCARGQFQAMWDDLVELMAEGVRTGRIDTVRPEHTPEAMGRPPREDDHGGEVYVYRRNGQPCHVCGATVRTEVLTGRNLFWCPRCQPRFRSRAVQ